VFFYSLLVDPKLIQAIPHLPELPKDRHETIY
jgi:hypothetical protein